MNLNKETKCKQEAVFRYNFYLNYSKLEFKKITIKRSREAQWTCRIDFENTHYKSHNTNS